MAHNLARRIYELKFKKGKVDKSQALNGWHGDYRGTGVVYLMKSRELYKIGISIEVDKRVKQLTSIIPFGVELIHVIPVNDYERLEQALHMYYQRKRVNGEWFELSEDDVNLIKSLDSNWWDRLYPKSQKPHKVYQQQRLEF
jgi:hypothetical protein